MAQQQSEQKDNKTTEIDKLRIAFQRERDLRALATLFPRAGVIELPDALYIARVRAWSESQPPNGSIPLWFVDNPMDLYHILQYRDQQTKPNNVKTKKAKELLVDVFITTTTIPLIAITPDYPIPALANAIRKQDAKFPEKADNEAIANWLQNAQLVANGDKLKYAGFFDTQEANQFINEIMLTKHGFQHLKPVLTTTLESILDCEFDETNKASTEKDPWFCVKRLL